MWVDERRVAALAALFAVAGIAMIFLMAETPRKASVAEALVANQNELLEVSGTLAEVSAGSAKLCDSLCITVRTDALASAGLLSEGAGSRILGRVREYRGNRYIVAEKILWEG